MEYLELDKKSKIVEMAYYLKSWGVLFKNKTDNQDWCV
jgi:hypothetical protein